MRFFKLFQVEEVGRAAVTVVRVRMDHIRRLVDDTRKGLVGSPVAVRRHAVAKVSTGRFDIVRLRNGGHGRVQIATRRQHGAYCRLVVVYIYAHAHNIAIKLQNDIS